MGTMLPSQDKEFPNWPCLEVSQEKAIEELREIEVERNTMEDFQCTPAMDTMYRSWDR